MCKPKALRVGPSYLYVDWGRCDGCGRCADACDRGAIVLRGASAPTATTAAVPPRAGAKAAPADPPAATPRARTRADAEPAPKAARPRPAGGATTTGAAWTLPEAGLVALVAFALLIGVQSFVAGVAGAPWTGIALLGYDAVLIALLWYLAQRRGADPSAAYRLDRWPELGSMVLALGVAAGCWVFSLAYRALVLAAGFLPGASEGADLTRVFGPSVAGAALTVLTVAVIGPALEELLLRGVVLGAVRRRLGDWPAVVITALVFAALHASVWSLLPLTVLGIGLGWLATRSRTLWPSILAHVLYNGVLVAAALYTASR